MAILSLRQKFYNTYEYKKRANIGYEETKRYFINNDISCMKYHYNVDKT